MRAERFFGATLLEAVRRAREALGPGALVVAVRGPERGLWPRRRGAEAFEVRARRPLAPAGELRRLEARIEELGAALERSGRLAEEMTALRRAVEALERRLAGEPVSALPVRTRVARVRIGPEGADRGPDPTARSVDAWTRSSSNS